MAAPSYIAKSAFASGTAALSVGAVSGVLADDLILLFIESENQAVPSTPTGGAGGTWVEVTGSPQGTGTAGAIGAVRLTVYYQIATGADATTTVADTGDHTCAIKVCIRGADTSSPFDATSGNVTTPASASLSMPTVTTSVADCLIVYGIAMDIDGASTARIGTVTNAALSTITERHDQTVATADGGGIGVITGVKATAGAVGTTTVAVTSTIAAYLTMAIKPVVLAVRTGSMSATETGTETLSGTGDVIVDGALSVSETGLDTLTASGTVAYPVITGSMAVTESGTDTATGSGDVIVRGSLSASEAGNDTAIGSGDVLVQGALTATEGAQDTFTGNGFGVTQATGTMSVTESGADALTASGDVLVQGSISAQEAGDDALAALGRVVIQGALSASEGGLDSFTASGSLGAMPVSGSMSAVEGSDATDTYAGDDYVASGYYQTGWYGRVLVQGTMSATESDVDRFSATGPVAQTDVRVGGRIRYVDKVDYVEASQRMAEWEALVQKFIDEPPKKQPKQAIEEVLPTLDAPMQSLSSLLSVAEAFELPEFLDIQALIKTGNVPQIAETAYLIELAIEQEKEAVFALALFME